MNTGCYFYFMSCVNLLCSHTYIGGFNVLKLLFKSIVYSVFSDDFAFANEKVHIELLCLMYTDLPGIGACPAIALTPCAVTWFDRKKSTENDNKSIFIIYLWLLLTRSQTKAYIKIK